MTTANIDQVLQSLKKSAFRARFALDQKDLSYIKSKGIDVIRGHAIDFILSRIAQEFPKNDGKQTPMKGHPVFTAQHATATCCRSCIQKWYGIKKGKRLTKDEISFIVNLIMEWIKEKVQDSSATSQSSHLQ